MSDTMIYCKKKNKIKVYCDSYSNIVPIVMESAFPFRNNIIIKDRGTPNFGR